MTNVNTNDKKKISVIQQQIEGWNLAGCKVYVYVLKAEQQSLKLYIGDMMSKTGNIQVEWQNQMLCLLKGGDNIPVGWKDVEEDNIAINKNFGYVRLR